MEDLGARALSCGNFSGEKIAFIGSSSSRPHTESTGTSTMPRGKKLSEKEIGRWPAKSTDLNPIENVWGQLAWSVYEGGRQFDTRDELKTPIKRSWPQLSRAIYKVSSKVCQRGWRK
ncbi:uncharacterized protein PITG_03648 [Phytophthora infestans T30-4]|uniref:Tc1-like transposase DDE domain-containing protein n=1 Tax=Phytophthora infestans (strain T30-4) TaxID=403677 RepID=D0MY58_PHYIT|nr:uncharacterized protein PITG_03648 [Phytophthora infestans T30-4]EEY66106.1 hypothetical protein PITG_03648 [Phytophthora infestans T30-4]|eukprot:XP_002906705.1 hypothetical protein PITG_03648 [Phytophthora infestans T30-4]